MIKKYWNTLTDFDIFKRLYFFIVICELWLEEENSKCFFKFQYRWRILGSLIEKMVVCDITWVRFLFKFHYRKQQKLLYICWFNQLVAPVITKLPIVCTWLWKPYIICFWLVENIVTVLSLEYFVEPFIALRQIGYNVWIIN